MTVVLGAGSSRDVDYDQEERKATPSPLDSDFFDLLQRLQPEESDQEAVFWVINQVLKLPFDCWRSLEKAFYTLHLSATMERLVLGDQTLLGNTPRQVVDRFTRALEALFRAAHGTSVSLNHQALLGNLSGEDTIISFNYDMVAEHALRDTAQKRDCTFGPWVYGLGSDPPARKIPPLLKLHGSSNWEMNEAGISVAEESWENALRNPGYRACKSPAGDDPSQYPIVLPYWDKPIERDPWCGLWRRASRALLKTHRLIVWGYSLPRTDLKAESLFRIAFNDRPISICVIDPSTATQDRWRRLLPRARFWFAKDFSSFRDAPPPWLENVDG
jgi:hypothetical protein